MNNLYPSFLLFSICLFSISCQSKDQDASFSIPSKHALAAKMWEADKILLIYGSQRSEFAATYQKLAEKIKTASSGDKLVEIKSDDEVTTSMFKNNICYLIGTPRSNRYIEIIKDDIPLQIQQGKLKLQDKIFRDTSTVFTLPLFPNPQHDKLPLTLVSGLNDNYVIAHIKDSFSKGQSLFGWSFWGYEVYREAQRVFFGNFHPQTWELDKNTQFDFTNPPDTLPSSAHFNFIKSTPLEEALADELSKKCEQIAQRIRQFVGLSKSIPKIDFCLYQSAEKKGLMIRNTDQATADFSENRVHVVLNETYADNLIGKENELLLRNLMGKPKTRTLERGLAIFFTENWQRKGYQYWAAKLFASDNMAPLTEVLDEQYQQNGSRYVMGSLAGSFVEFLLAKWGRSKFLQQYLAWEPNKKTLQVLEKEWHTYLEEQQAQFLFQPLDDTITYVKGFNFAHEGYQVYNGYISKEATRSLAKLKTLGTNTIAIVPYSYMRNPRKPSEIPIIRQAGAENDESVIHSCRMAQQIGMQVALKPQIWIGSNSWPGDIEMATEMEWQQWFEEYYRWIRHYALLAEIQEMEIFVLGTEFAKATIQRPKDWQQLIKKIRGIYSGKLTYAANWGEEFEQITFWEDLDFIGLNCYYPLSKNLQATDKELKNGFAEIIKKIERIQRKTGKQLIFTEIGFRSIEAPWTNPHAEPNRPYHAEHQRQCYEIVFEAIQSKDWCHGTLWWKYPSYLDYRGAKNTSFTPNEKPAEETVRKWFMKE